MSGAFGWGGNDRRDTYSPSPTPDRGFSRAVGAYNNPPSTPAPSRAYGTNSYVDPDYKSRVTPVARSMAAPMAPVDVSPTRTFKSTKQNVIIVASDVTGSLGSWRADIFKFLPLLYQEAQQYLGDDLEIMFIAYGDVQYGDPIQVATFAGGPVLDHHLTSLYKDATGGGNKAESSEIVAYFLHESVDTSSAKNVYTFFITDEPCQPTVSGSDVQSNLGLTMNTELRSSRAVFTSLLRKMELYVVFAETNSYAGHMESFKQAWRDIVGAERVCPMPRSNLVIETMLGVMAKTTGQLQKFSQNFTSRRGNTQFGAVNQSIVAQSIALVPGAGPSVPNIAAKSRLLTGD